MAIVFDEEVDKLIKTILDQEQPKQPKMGNEHFNGKYKNLVVYLLQVRKLFARLHTFPPKLEIESNVKVLLATKIMGPSRGTKTVIRESTVTRQTKD